MKDLMFPVGISNFSEIRTKGYYYIDKTNLIAETSWMAAFAKVNIDHSSSPFRKITWYEHSCKFSGHHQRQQADV